MGTTIRYLGVAGYEIITSAGQHILADPFLDLNPGAPCKSHELERVDFGYNRDTCLSAVLH